MLFITEKVKGGQKDSFDTCDSRYLMREKITFLILVFCEFFCRWEANP